MIERDGRTIRRIAHGPLRGTLFEFETSSENAYWWGSYEAEVQRLIDGLGLDGGLAWDIGAHVGFFSLLLSLRCDRVVAVEPHPHNASRLRTNVRLNRAPVEVVEAAVGRAPGVVRIAGAGRTSGVGDGVGALEVRRTTLDQLAEQHGAPSFVKLDVEGAELEALQGASTVLARRPAILVETHSPRLTADVAELLRAARYVVSGAHDSTEPFVPAHLLAVAAP
jgi:FkbM family methyltransferase